jgi:hypothetical protein
MLLLASTLGIACSNSSGARRDAAGGTGPTGGSVGGASGGNGGATGGAAGGQTSAGATGTGGALGGSTLDAAVDSATGADSSDAAPDASALGVCETDDDCIAVLNYRSGFECWWPTMVSKADVSRDACLIPWKPNPRCTTARPPADCPGGDQPVTHSCFTMSCIAPTCNAGRCSSVLCDKRDAGPATCSELRTAYLIALAAAQQCSPSTSASACQGVLVDPCGCKIPYDSSGICGDAVSAALNEWRNAGCTGPSCGGSCAMPGAAGATCAANDGGTMGTCVWK